ncbi:MAG: alpha/beta fold hydrolase [Alphaproteobacteria bacterium]
MALSCQIKPPRAGGTARSAVILIHGFGDSGAGLIGLADPLSAHLPHTVFISPDAPNPCEMAVFGFQWFGLEDWSPQALYNGALRAAPVLDEFIGQQLEAYKIAPAQLALVGFSQGCMMALHVGLRRPQPVAAVLGFSGALVGAEWLSGEIKSRPPVMLVHGMMDTVVPYPAMPASAHCLKNLGVPVVTETRPALGHSIDAESLEKGGAFLARHLTA